MTASHHNGHEAWQDGAVVGIIGNKQCRATGQKCGRQAIGRVGNMRESVCVKSSRSIANMASIHPSIHPSISSSQPVGKQEAAMW